MIIDYPSAFPSLRECQDLKAAARVPGPGCRVVAGLLSLLCGAIS